MIAFILAVLIFLTNISGDDMRAISNNLLGIKPASHQPGNMASSAGVRQIIPISTTHLKDYMILASVSDYVSSANISSVNVAVGKIGGEMNGLPAGGQGRIGFGSKGSGMDGLPSGRQGRTGFGHR